MRRFNVIIFIIGLLFTACQSKKESWNADIPSPIRSEIKSCNDSIMAAIAGNNPRQLKRFFSDSLAEQTKTDLDSVVQNMNALIKTADYSPLDECYVKQTSANGRDTVKNDKSNHAYSVNFEGSANETYISLLLHEGNDGQLLITCIYQKENDQWKLNVFRVGRYSYFGITAVDIYHEAKDKYEKGDVTDAANMMALAKQPLTPAYQFFHYDKEKEIKEFARKVVMEADTVFRFPNLVGELKSEPVIYNIRPLPMKEGIFPVITYGTKISISDTLAVQKENDELQKIIGQFFPGIEKNNKFIFFQVYKQTPKGLDPASHLELVMHGTVSQP
jgi:hypothetical protein